LFIRNVKQLNHYQPTCAEASTPFKLWSKCSMENLGEALEPILGGILIK